MGHLKYNEGTADEIAAYSRQRGRAAAREHYKLTEGQLGGLLYRVKTAPRTRRLTNVRIAPEEPITIVGDGMIVGDVHVPTTDYDICHRMAVVALNFLQEPRQLIVAGDMFNLDFLSVYPPISKTPEWKREKLTARALLKEWLTVFDRILIITGNHDRRITKATAGHMTTEDLIDMVYQDKRIVTSEWGHCILKSGDRSFRVTHGRNYSVNTGTVGNDLSHKFEMNIISHHQHHASISLDRFKRYIVVDNAALVKAESLAYATLDDSKMPGMARGFCMVRDGEPQLFVEGITVWKHWVGKSRRGNGKRKARAA